MQKVAMAIAFHCSCRKDLKKARMHLHLKHGRQFRRIGLRTTKKLECQMYLGRQRAIMTWVGGTGRILRLQMQKSLGPTSLSIMPLGCRTPMCTVTMSPIGKSQNSME